MSLTCNIRNLAGQVKNKLVGERRRSSSSHDFDTSVEITGKHGKLITIQKSQQHTIQSEQKDRTTTATAISSKKQLINQQNNLLHDSNNNSLPCDATGRSSVFESNNVTDKRLRKQQYQTAQSICRCQVSCTNSSQTNCWTTNGNSNSGIINLQSKSHSSCIHHNTQEAHNKPFQKICKQVTPLSIPSPILQEQLRDYSENETDTNMISETSLQCNFHSQNSRYQQHPHHNHQSQQHSKQCVHVSSNEQSRHNISRNGSQQNIKASPTSPHVSIQTCNQPQGTTSKENKFSSTTITNDAITPVPSTSNSTNNSHKMFSHHQRSDINLHGTTDYPLMNSYLQQHGSTYFIPVIPDLSVPQDETRSGSLGSAYPSHCIPYHFGHSKYALIQRHNHHQHCHESHHHHHKHNEDNNSVTDNKINTNNNIKSMHTSKYNNPRLTMSYSELLNSLIPQHCHNHFKVCGPADGSDNSTTGPDNVNIERLDHLTKSQIINSNSPNNLSNSTLNVSQQLDLNVSSGNNIVSNNNDGTACNSQVFLNSSEVSDIEDVSQSYSYPIQSISKHNPIVLLRDQTTSHVELNPPVLPTRTSSLIMNNKKCYSNQMKANVVLPSILSSGPSSSSDNQSYFMQQSMIEYPNNYVITDSGQCTMNNLSQSQHLNLSQPNNHLRSNSTISSKRGTVNERRSYENTCGSVTVNASTETISNNEVMMQSYTQQSPTPSHHELLSILRTPFSSSSSLDCNRNDTIIFHQHNERSPIITSVDPLKDKQSISQNESSSSYNKSFTTDSIPTSPSCGALEQFMPTNHASRLLGRMSGKLRDGRLADVILIAGIKSNANNSPSSSSLSSTSHTKCINLTMDSVHATNGKSDSNSSSSELIIRIPAHRVILAAASDYFAAMFGNELKEATEQEIWIHDVEPNALKTLINYIYTGYLDLREETIGDLLAAACFLQITEASQACERFLTKRLDATNCISMSRLSEQYGCELLRRRSTTFVLENFSDVAQQPDFLNLSFKELNALVSSDRLKVSNEATVFAACLRWIRNAKQQEYKTEIHGNESLLANLLKHIRLTQLPPRLLIDVLEKETLFQEDLSAIRLVISALRVHFSSESFHYSQIHKTQTRTNLDWCLRNNQLTNNANDTNNSIHSSLLDTRTSSRSSVSSSSTTTNDNQFFTGQKTIRGSFQQNSEETTLTTNIGGSSSGTNRSHNYNRYHHHHPDQPYQSPQFSIRIPDDKIVTYDENCSQVTKPRPSTIGRLWALGGKTMTTTRALQEILEYDPYWNTWRTIGQLPGQRQQCGCTILVDGRLLVVGGRDELKTLSTVECINIEEISQMNECTTTDPGKKINNTKLSLETSSRPRTMRNRSRQNSEERNEIDVVNTNQQELSNGPTNTTNFTQQGQHNSRNCTTSINKEVQNKEEYGSWKIVSAMATHRHGLGVAVLEGVVYAVGGHDGWSYLNTVERWNGKAKSWSPVTPMAVQRSTVGVAVLEGLLYAVGGRDGSACLRTVERFNPHTQHWCFIAPMLHRRGGVGVGAIGGRLYAVGGHNAPPNQPHALRTASVEMYEPRTDMWTEVCALSSPRDSIAIAPLGYKLYALGGHDGQSYTDRVEVYDPEENKWTEAAPLPSGRAGVAVAASGPGVTDTNFSIKLSYHKVDPLI
ncbi:Kelch-like protein 5 [Schistosoma japonicum]|nr:Kelch-like protein 5 [Schistosoma japonicum]